MKEIEREISFNYIDKFTIKVTDKQSKSGNITWTYTLTPNEEGKLISRKDDNVTIKYEYDENVYLKAIYDINENNEKIGMFT